MIGVPKPTPYESDNVRERTGREHALDEALKDTFPASDPVSIEPPAPPASDRDSER